MKNKVYIIAEMSANHCGNFDNAIKIIEEAKNCGADAIKIQTYTADTMTINCRNENFMGAKNSPWENMNSYDLYSEAMTPWEWQPKLKKYADKIGIDLFSSPFDFSAVDFLEKMNVPAYKIASFEAIDIPLIEYTASKMKPIFISTGICSPDEISEALKACFSVGNKDVTLFKCTSAYPAKLEDMNLLTIPDMRNRFNVNVGISDHTMDNETVVTAVALGARVIEKHFTLDRAMGGADCKFSLNPNEFSKMVQAVRRTEKLLGRISYSYNENSRKHGRSLFVVKNIKKDEKFTKENIRSIRPNYGLHTRYYNDILGKTANQDLEYGMPFKIDYIKE